MLNSKELLQKLNWIKTNGLIPVIIQENLSHEVLMHGYMNQDAFLKTQKDGVVTFYSRTKKRLWTKGETSGNFLKVQKITTDCDYDALLILVKPLDETCHLRKKSCFFLEETPTAFLFNLEKIIENRKIIDINNSYTSKLYKSGTHRIAQKVGEEAIETILAAMKKDKNELINESSDLIYHLIVLLHDQDLDFNTVIQNLKMRKN
ncbi:bifunctional phosphoribosyl-AMP cyclohydrolase/phosphoribosyl-ATP diphosphatase HisIE [Buchnera aphidicola (Muscaphis stroyani)]|uniref:Histidine biosynthesis bifunctional protein HisIE n=1 Tax=Buchnera aphidicola (Muscaphis stroyani) TaxID=1241869 RepID=A0A4D6YF43_9GAMM|nr:bifunctional phosphoribosyl-AMP cyclohydrolase/phosphoribosyl-ATP diphosphatase HisIE [Buchnera aphidicola]QCI24210.1 bifunctional phosphoribosyl-AMP cyclohydrolase/phosphoribosyl-ATP diphosphatase HisIE [Buchnera aphidicola (Muscaphis stroyani)]